MINDSSILIGHVKETEHRTRVTCPRWSNDQRDKEPFNNRHYLGLGLGHFLPCHFRMQVTNFSVALGCEKLSDQVLEVHVEGQFINEYT